MGTTGDIPATTPVPVEVRWIADKVGEELTFSFIEACGGQKLWVPAVRIENSNLARTWGLELATCLSRRWGGSQYSVPLVRQWRVRRLALAGFSHNDIAVRVGLTRRQIVNILYNIRDSVASNRRLVDERQFSLF